MSDERVLEELRRLEIETLSRSYGNSGRASTRTRSGAARNGSERIDDAVVLHR